VLLIETTSCDGTACCLHFSGVDSFSTPQLFAILYIFLLPVI
jgi:hypothetical protein